MNEQEFINELKLHNINPTSKQLELLNKYYELIISYNAHTNITAITKKEDVYLKHFYDSLTSSFFVNYEPNKTLLDIGSGAGLPGVVLKIFFPELKVILLDSNNKKTTFLQLVIDQLQLKDIEVVKSRCEEYIQLHREDFDYVIARAVKEMNILAELAIPFVKTDGLFIAMKGVCNEEITNSSKAISILGGVLLNTNCFELPNDIGQRTIVVIKKISSSNSSYPRDYSEIIKKPLK